MLKNEKGPWDIVTEDQFIAAALLTFREQYKHNAIYRRWCDLLGRTPETVKTLAQLPFLPIRSFRESKVLTGPEAADAVIFRSSGTTGQSRSLHIVNDVSLYKESFSRGFRLFYGQPSAYCILALLPGYLERGDSSLVYMCAELIRQSGHPLSGFYLRDADRLPGTIAELKASRQNTLIIGVSYALLDLCETGVKLDPNFTVMETGGMKGTRREMLKAELHEALKKGLGIAEVHSEYGMTEMLSQAYSRGDGLFHAPPWLRFLTRETDDPLKIRADGKTGGVNVIDLANIHSCAFIATQDLGRLHGNRLELMGRYDDSDVRGCNLMVG